MVKEAGKTREADADVCEAIDFCEVRTTGAQALRARTPRRFIGELDEHFTSPAAWLSSSARGTSACDLLRHDRGGSGHGQHRGRQARRADAPYRRRDGADLP